MPLFFALSAGMNKTCGDQPCSGCPFRKTAMPGWLGAASPERFALAILADTRLPCHMTIDYDDPNWRDQWLAGEQGILCAGALVLSANIHKKPRDPDVRVMGPSDKVFDNLDGFIAYHRSAAVKSWPDSEDKAALAAWKKMGTQRYLAAFILLELEESTSRLYLETVRNPGKDDGKCALCESPGLDEDQRCFGCGYLVCDECDTEHPEGLHLVVAHNEEFI